MHRKNNKNSDEFLALADQFIIYNLRKSWLMIAKVFNEMAAAHDSTISMAFVLLTLDEKGGTPVTKIAPRMGMEPNSLSRILKSMEQKGLIKRTKDQEDKRQTFISLTKKGKADRKLAIKVVYSLEKSIQDNISGKELKLFLETAKEIPAAVESFKEAI